MLSEKCKKEIIAKIIGKAISEIIEAFLFKKRERLKRTTEGTIQQKMYSFVLRRIIRPIIMSKICFYDKCKASETNKTQKNQVWKAFLGIGYGS